MKQMLADSKSGDGLLSDLIVDIVTSRQFRHRRAASPTTAQVSSRGRQP
jgi:hypothetical protein